MPSLFERYTLKDSVLKNRIVVSPMSQYMAENGVINDWQFGHLTTMARGGSGLVFTEEVAVAPEGRITPFQAGLWNDEQAEALAKAARLIKQNGSVPGIQIAHAGRKANANRPWDGDAHIPAGDSRAWETIGPSPISYGELLPRVPREMTIADIQRVIADFAATAVRALDAGFEWLELHFAHGFLAQSFFSPHANKRTDAYGGSAENRRRFPLEVLAAVRKVWPERLPLIARLGVIEFDDPQLDAEKIADSIALTRAMKAGGLDMLDVSLGFNTPKARVPFEKPGFLVDIAADIGRQAEIPIATSWSIFTPDQADAIVREEKADLVMLGKPLLANPHWPYFAAQQLGVESPSWVLPAPYAHWLARYPRDEHGRSIVPARDRVHRTIPD
ncbi:NADH:flavin oxidoreductase/NADH oxidase [Sphingomonas tagetis]|uniref:NADH:flavin oxidoreductase/NADH oxidase n=1 Tax=Sphingomonas tagetis TaxID=2949092 RepID=UPI00265E4F26|nr:NADH:flavin oxidoreductase/NADH oxidase [Sphingomonas tagetis]